MKTIFLLSFLLLVTATACTNQTRTDSTRDAIATEPSELSTGQSADAASAQDAPEVADEAPTRPGARPWSQEGLYEQPRMAALIANTPADLGRPASTNWLNSDVQVPDSLTANVNPAQLLYAFVHEHRIVDGLNVDVWEHTLRIHQIDDTTAEAVILTWGIKDDAVAGYDLLLEMSTDDLETWSIDAIKERFHCLRGVTNGLCS